MNEARLTSVRIPRLGWLLIAVAAFLALVALAWAPVSEKGESNVSPRPVAERPTLMLLTSLPLVFPEAFTIEGGGSPALSALESRYRVEPIGHADSESLDQGRMLLMAHALAQPAEALVDLDAWVRRGGRLLLLADPKLDRPSIRPLGDKLRPPPSFADTGLLSHWGITLYMPGHDGPSEQVIDGRWLRLSSAGSLTGRCQMAGDGLVARCRIGKGAVTVIADADLLDPPGGTAAGRESNLQFLLAELALLESR